jgi:hypothetical protein
MEECRIYLCTRDETIYCVVSPEDYAWALQWKWHYRYDKHKTKMYATRSSSENGRPKTVYMHKAILSERMKSIPPSDKHTIGNHGETMAGIQPSLNNKRDNLEWVTPSENSSRKLSRRWRHLPEPANDNSAKQEAA